MAKKNKRKRKKTTATKSEVPVTTRDDSDQDKDEKEKLPEEKEEELAKGATPAAHELAASQLDSDDDDCYKRSSNHPKQDASLRKERRKLYELQESKRRLRTEEGRSKSKSAHGETPLARKVKRLKTERKAILDEYKETGGSMRKNNNNNNTNKRKKKRSAGIPLPSNK